MAIPDFNKNSMAKSKMAVHTNSENAMKHLAGLGEIQIGNLF